MSGRPVLEGLGGIDTASCSSYDATEPPRAEIQTFHIKIDDEGVMYVEMNAPSTLPESVKTATVLNKCMQLSQESQEIEGATLPLTSIPEEKQSVQTTTDDICLESADIGSRFNQWCKPVTEYGSNSPYWEGKLKSSPYIGEIDFGRCAWARARAAVDEVLRLLQIEIRANAEEHYKGLRIEKYIRMGSSRDGLKIISPDEFDVLLLFHIEGLEIKVVQLRKGSKVIPEFCHLQVNIPMTWLQQRYPKLCKDGIFQEDNTGRVKLDAKQLHQAVFESLVDRAVENITEKIKSGVGGNNVCFRITRRINPPSVNITMHFNDKVLGHFMPGANIREPNEEICEIDVDIVPGFLIRTDQFPDPSNLGCSIECPVYAVSKWSETSSVRGSIFPNPDIVWRVSSSGYERHTLDVARSDLRQRYVLTALRILKTYFRKTKAAAQERNQAPPQITTFFSSYHLKHIAFYVLLYLCYIHKEVRIHGVCDVLLYFIRFLKCSLEEKRLPHFFHSNDKIRDIYPTYPVVVEQLRFNLLMWKSDEAYSQAKMSLDNHLMPEMGIIWRGNDEMQRQILSKYRGDLSYGDILLKVNQTDNR